MNWFYRYENNQDYLSQEPGPLGLHDLALGQGNVVQLLRNISFSKENIKRLIMSGFVKFMLAPDYSKLLPGVVLRCADNRGTLYDCTVIGKDEDTLWKVSKNGEEILIDLDEIKFIQEEAVGNNRREGVVEAPAKPAVTAEMVIAKYIETRDVIEAEKKIYDEKVEALKAVQLKREQWLTAQLDSQGLTNFKKSGVGTAFFKKRSSATMADQIEFVKWVREDWDGRQHFLDKRVSKTAVDAWVDEGNTIPPGTNYTTTRVIQINRG